MKMCRTLRRPVALPRTATRSQVLGCAGAAPWCWRATWIAIFSPVAWTISMPSMRVALSCARLGLQMVRAFAARGAKLVLVDRSEAHVREVFAGFEFAGTGLEK